LATDKTADRGIIIQTAASEDGDCLFPGILPAERLSQVLNLAAIDLDCRPSTLVGQNELIA
jgi:hypothetical protein